MSSLRPCSRPCASAGRIQPASPSTARPRKARPRSPCSRPTLTAISPSLTAAISKAIGATSASSASRRTPCSPCRPTRRRRRAPRCAPAHPALRIMSAGEAIEIYKEVGYPTDVPSRFDLRQDAGLARHRPYPHGDRVGRHDLGAHPFSTGPDQCLVHNGSLSNHNNLRRELDPRRHDASRPRTIPRSPPPTSPGA